MYNCILIVCNIRHLILMATLTGQEQEKRRAAQRKLESLQKKNEIKLLNGEKMFSPLSSYGNKKPERERGCDGPNGGWGGTRRAVNLVIRYANAIEEEEAAACWCCCGCCQCCDDPRSVCVCEALLITIINKKTTRATLYPRMNRLESTAYEKNRVKE